MSQFGDEMSPAVFGLGTVWRLAGWPEAACGPPEADQSFWGWQEVAVGNGSEEDSEKGPVGFDTAGEAGFDTVGEEGFGAVAGEEGYGAVVGEVGFGIAWAVVALVWT